MAAVHKESPVDLTTALRDTERHLKALLGAGITRKAVLVLLAHETGLAMKTVDQVLAAATNLSKFTESVKCGPLCAGSSHTSTCPRGHR